MSPLKIAIAAFVVGLIALTASATKRSASTRECESSRPPTITIFTPDKKRYEYEYQPRLAGLTIEDIEKYIEPKKMGHYRTLLTSLHLYDMKRESFTLDGNERIRKLPPRKELEKSIKQYEMEVLEKKEKDPRPWEGVAAKRLDRAQAEQLAAAQAEQPDAAQAEQPDAAQAERVRARNIARVRARERTRAIARTRAEAAQLAAAQAEQPDAAQAEQPGGAQFGNDTPINYNQTWPDMAW